MIKRPDSAGDSTRSVHGGERDHQETTALTTPIYQTSTFWFEDSEILRAYQEGRADREEYGRYGNPTWKAVERKLSTASKLVWYGPAHGVVSGQEGSTDGEEAGEDASDSSSMAA